MSKSFEPIIKRQKSSLQEKNVSIKGTNDFGRSPIHSPNDLPIEIKKTQIQKQFKESCLLYNITSIK